MSLKSFNNLMNVSDISDCASAQLTLKLMKLTDVMHQVMY